MGRVTDETDSLLSHEADSQLERSRVEDRKSPIRLRDRARSAFVLGTLSGLVIVGYLYLRSSRDGIDPADIVTVTRGDIEETVSALGRLQPFRSVDVGAQASGQIVQISVEAGSKVRTGDLLVEIDPQIEAAKVEEDRAQLANLHAQLADQKAQSLYAGLEYERQGHLRATGVVSQDSYDQSVATKQSAAAKVVATQASIREAESTLKADETTLGYTKIYAPISGTVITLDAKQGQTINTNFQTPEIMTIADLATMTVWAQVSEADVPRLNKGMEVYFTTLGSPGRRWFAKLRKVLPAPVKQRQPGDTTTTATDQPSQTNNVVVYTVLFDVANPGGMLKAEMTAQVFFVLAKATDTIVVPTTALTPIDEDAGHYSVTVLRPNGEPEHREVRIGLKERFRAQVLSGLSAGDRLVIPRSSDAADRS
jgi:membrane fusion protein, macrolide-specific efflux system